MKRFLPILFVALSTLFIISPKLAYAEIYMAINPGIPISGQSAMYIATGCPANSDVEFFWVDSLGDNVTNQKIKADGSGRATATQTLSYRPNPNQQYAVSVKCGTESKVFRFDVAETAPVTITLDPNPPVYGVQATYTANGCPANTPIKWTWYNLDIKFNGDIDSTTDGSGKSTVTQTINNQLLASDRWSARVTCGAKNLSKDYDIRKPSDTLTIVVNPNPPFKNDPNLKFEIKGCPVGSNVSVKVRSSAAFAGTVNEQFSGTADSNGEIVFKVTKPYASVSPFVWNVLAECGTLKTERSFNPKDEEIPAGTPVVYPTQPAPPKPPCDEFDDKGRCAKIKVAIGTFSTDPKGFITDLFSFILGLSGGLATLIIIYAGYLWVTSQGKPDQLQRGREMIVSAIVGLLFIVFSFVIMETITGDILHLPGFPSTWVGGSPDKPGPK